MSSCVAASECDSLLVNTLHANRFRFSKHSNPNTHHTQLWNYYGASSTEIALHWLEWVLRTDISDSIRGPTSGIFNENRTVAEASLNNVRNQNCALSTSCVTETSANRWRRFCKTVALWKEKKRYRNNSSLLNKKMLVIDIQSGKQHTHNVQVKKCSYNIYGNSNLHIYWMQLDRTKQITIYK
jgi:hypothetical protein